MGRLHASGAAAEKWGPAYMDFLLMLLRREPHEDSPGGMLGVGQEVANVASKGNDKSLSNNISCLPWSDAEVSREEEEREEREEREEKEEEGERPTPRVTTKSSTLDSYHLGRSLGRATPAVGRTNCQAALPCPEEKRRGGSDSFAWDPLPPLFVVLVVVLNGGCALIDPLLMLAQAGSFARL